MLSVENPPPDPSWSSQFLQLNDSNSDVKASDKLLLPEVDLLKQPHDHLPKFSIRSYVFTSRSKDINKNWPFSLKNLQLCLKHGVKHVLPPFQPLSAVKSQSIKRCTVETCSLEKKIISNFDAEPSGPNEKEVLDLSGNSQLNNKLENDCIDTSSCRSGGENDFPSTTTSVSHSEVSTKRPSSSSLETDILLSASASASATVEVGAAAHSTSHNSENTSRPPGKKCRLIVKFSGNSDRSSTEDIASNSTAVSETMASIICPVCKTFTSSSNTTLNAHIDQCLSVESTPKWTADSKPTRHIIKPRKTRLMVDIYSTAQMCTLEELDRRNGTNWATVSNLPTQDKEKLEIAAEWKRKRKRVSQVHPEDTGDVGEVYIDANGTKLRILSKYNDDAAVSVEVEDFQPKNPLKGGKGSKFLSTKRKKRHARTHLKYPKLAPQSRKLFSRKACAPQIRGDHEEGYGVEERWKEKYQIQKHIKSCDSGALRQWVCSKRTALTNKVKYQDSGQTFRYKLHKARDLLVDNGRSSLGKSLTERNRIQKYANLSENLLTSPAISDTAEKPFYDGQLSDKWELSSGRKRVGSLLYGDKVSENIEKSCLPLKPNGNQLSRDTPIIHGSQTFESSNRNINRISSLSNKRVGVHAGNDSDIPPRASTASMCTQAFASALSKPILRKNRSSVPKSKHNRDEKCLAGKKTRPDLVGNVDEEVAAWDSEVDQQYALMCKGGRKEINDKMSFGRNTIRGMIQDREAVSTSQGKEAMALESSESPQCYGNDDGENTDSSARASDDLIDRVDVLESVEDAVATVSGSVDTKFKQLSGRSNSQLNSLHSIEDYNGMLCGGEAVTGPTVPSFVDGQEMYDSDEAGNGIIGQNAHMEPGVDSDIGQGHSFPEVDRIPIPGPPGSFLPSPRDMGSDDFQGNSSLTTSRVQSSQDQVDLVDGDFSDSPISVASITSNSTAKRSEFKYSEPLLSVGAQPVQDKTKSGFSTAGLEPLVENVAVVAQTTMGVEKSNFDGEKSKVNKIIEKGPLNFKNDGQRCCCQRKERISQDIAPNYQESLPWRRRTVKSLTVPAKVKQNVGPNNLDVRPELFWTEKAVLPMIRSLAGSIPVKGSPEAGVKFLGHGDCDSPSPSTPNPVLRLMGKNLMVVNKEEDASVPFGQSQPRTQNGHVISQFPTSSRVSPGNMLNQDCHSFQHMAPEGPVIFSHNPYEAAGQPFDVRLSRCFRNQINLRTPQTPAQVANLFGNQHVHGGFRTSMESHIYENAYSLSSTHDRPKIRLREVSSYNMGNTVTTLDSLHNNADCGASIQEIIVVDDVPESEANLSVDVAKYSEGLRASQMISSGISIPTVPNINSRHVNPFPCHQTQDPSVLGDFHAFFSGLPNASPVRWGCTTEGSSMLQRSPFIAAPTSTGHVRSGTYYAPSLS